MEARIRLESAQDVANRDRSARAGDRLELSRQAFAPRRAEASGSQPHRMALSPEWTERVRIQTARHWHRQTAARPYSCLSTLNGCICAIRQMGPAIATITAQTRHATPTARARGCVADTPYNT
jgi:hypothetical protein